jgi:hypothetical protein
MRVVILAPLLAGLAACGSGSGDAASTPAPLEPCPLACGSLEVVGSLVELQPAKAPARAFSQVTKTGQGWAVAWDDFTEAASFLQHIDENGSPTGSAVRIDGAQQMTSHWDGTSLSVWARVTATADIGRGPERLSYASFDASLASLEAASLLGPESMGSLVAFGAARASSLAYTTPRVAAPVRLLRIQPGPALEQVEHFLSAAEQGTARMNLAWTGRELAASYFTSKGYLTTFLDATTLDEVATVELGTTSAEPPQDIQSVMIADQLWVVVWDEAGQRLLLRAVDVNSHAVSGDAIELPWTGVLTGLARGDGAPLVIGRPSYVARGEPENDVILPLDARSGRTCEGTRLGYANIVDLELDNGEGGALLDVLNEHVYFARVRCKR